MPSDQIIPTSSDRRTPPLPIPSAPCDTISVDFIVELPQSAGHNSIMVVINSVTKHAHFISMVTTISAAGAAHLFLNHMWKHHGLPWKVVSDRGPQFVAEFTWELYRLLGIKLAATTAYHPQGDGQTNSSTRNWNNISVFSPIKDRMIGGAPAIHRIPVQQPSSFFHPAHSFPPRPWMRSSNGL